MSNIHPDAPRVGFRSFGVGYGRVPVVNGQAPVPHHVITA